jgi:5-methylcytosine-specific restriction endonuclease McrA
MASAWRRVVERAIADQPWCSRCGRTDRLSGDHIIPLSKGGTDDPSNVRVLCVPCNVLASRLERRAEALGEGRPLRRLYHLVP